MIAALDAWFDRVAGAVHAFGAEVLKFIALQREDPPGPVRPGIFRGLNNAARWCYRHTILSAGARTMTEAQALVLLFVVLLFVGYGVWDLSHHR